MAGAKEEQLPEHVVEMEILPRFPIKSLTRFQSVSKHWCDLISNHLHHFRFPNVTSSLFFRFPISVSNEFYAITTTTTHLRKTNIDTSLSFLPPQDNLHVIDCCNGLLLCRFFWREQHDTVLCVCNPFTRRYTIIPELLYSTWEALVLVFDPSVSQHFKIIYFGNYVLHIFSSELGQWVSKPLVGYLVANGIGLDLINPNRVFLGGRIYLSSERDPLLVAVNGEGDHVGRINLPRPELGERRRRLGHSRGRLCYALKVDDEMRVWVLEDFDSSRWALRCSVRLEVFLRRSPRGIDSDYPEILRFHPDSDAVFVRVEGTLLCYDFGSGDLAKICNCGTLKWQAAFPYSPFYSEDVDL